MGRICLFDMERKTTFIYSLNCPDTGMVKYVGKSNEPKQRLHRHIRAIGMGETYRCANWLRSLQKAGKGPTLKILEECLIENWKERESFWISYYRNLTPGELTNCKNGGDGIGILSEETRQKMASAKIGTSHHKGFKNSDESKAKMSQSAKNKFVIMPQLKIAIRENQKKAAEKNRGLNKQKVMDAKFMFFLGMGISKVKLETGINYHVLEKIKQNKNYSWVNL